MFDIELPEPDTIAFAPVFPTTTTNFTTPVTEIVEEVSEVIEVEAEVVIELLELETGCNGDLVYPW